MGYAIEGSTGAWEVVVGLEVHAQVISQAKLFSGAATDFGAPPNTQVSFVDAAFPGMLPVINRECVAQAVRTGLGLNAHINVVSRFDRKNYFYADLPAGYQISQYQHPIVGEGRIEIELADGSTRDIGITRLHLEQDAGKSLHDQHPTMSYIDLNRAGVALMEIVSEPDLRSPEEAGAYVRKLRTILRYLGTCDGNMEEGSMRADVNVSVRRHGEPYRTRCEVKNVNSVRFVMQAVEAEAKRQIEVWESGGTVEQETRLFDSGRGVTRSMRTKEDAHDYRYFPDPDLLPLVLDEAWVAQLKSQLPELPDAKKLRFMRDFGLTAYDAGVLVAEHATADFFETVAQGRDAKVAANWVTGDLFAALNRAGTHDRRQPGFSRGARQAARSSVRQHDQRPHCQGRVRGNGGDRRGSRRNSRGEGAASGHRYRRDRCRGGNGAGGECRQGCGLQGRAREAVRLLRRPGDEGDGRQGQSPAGQRDAEAETVTALTVKPCHTVFLKSSPAPYAR